MNKRRSWFVVLAVLAVFSLVAAACGDDDATTTTAVATTTTAGPTTTAAPTTTGATTTTAAPAEILFDTGVTLEPCPGSANPENGCIYLGNISDFSGPFAGFGAPLAAGHIDFWTRVNAAGGIGPDGGKKFDVVISEDNTIDAGYVAEQHVAGYEQIRGNVAALAETLGTLQTLAALPLYIEDSTIAAVSTWYSGWSFPEFDGGLILETGSSYCAEAMNGFDVMVNVMASMGKDTFTYGIVKFPGDYGEDYAAGIKYAAEQYGLGDPLAEQMQIPMSAGGTLDDAVIAMVTNKPDVIFVVTGPQELATLMGGVAQAGYQTALYMGVGPSWNPALLATAVRPLLEAGVFFHTSPTAGWDADTPGHVAMRAAFEAAGRDVAYRNLGYIAGWSMQYNIKAALETAIANGDLTRAGIMAAANSLTAVDYEGMIPAKSFVGSPAETTERSSVVHRIDVNSSDGLAVFQDLFVGPTAASYPFTAPCAVLGG